MEKKFYITTTIPYVNARPHIGMALEVVQADAMARYRRLEGDDVLFNFGTDEHGQKIFEKAKEEGKEPQAYTDEYSASFQKLKEALNLSYDLFVRTTDPHHKSAAQEFWRRCAKKGDIYKKNYKVKYCVGCELEKTDSELVEGRCPVHPNLVVEEIDEENYFFKLSKYQGELLELFKDENFLIPRFRLNEMTSLIERDGLQDFSISRLKSKMSWGVPVPDDEDHVMYVWFDALVNYISTLGWPEDEQKFKDFWPGMQVAGKDQVRQQAVMWQAMLMSADLPTTKQIFIHGFINSGGQKMSKSLGNVIDPIDIVNEYGTDALRYFLLREIHPYEDSDFTKERFLEAYNANLANGIGNLTSRIMKMAEDNLEGPVDIAPWEDMGEYHSFYDKFEFNLAMDFIWKKIAELDGIIQKTEPYKLVKTDKEKGVEIIKDLVVKLYSIRRMLTAVMPETSAKIKEAIKSNKMPKEALFMRK